MVSSGLVPGHGMAGAVLTGCELDNELVESMDSQLVGFLVGRERNVIDGF